MSIKFGTDGWRAIIADGYTFANLARVARGTARWLHGRAGRMPGVVIGHDARFLGRLFAEHAARIFAAEGVRVTFADGITPTPALSWAARAYAFDAGIVITASHNPPEYNGFKIKAGYGGPATPEMIQEVEAEIETLDDAGVAPERFDRLVERGDVTVLDVRTGYLDLLRERLDLDAIRRSGLKIAHDPMYGAAMGAVAALLGNDCVAEIHGVFNPGFGGVAPEPIERNLGELAALIPREGCAVGLAHDGDADRIGMYDEQGCFVSSHQILALLVQYLYEERGLSGTVVKTFSTTHLLEKMGAAYGLPVETVPIGFKHIVPKILAGGVLVGGEESGGIAVEGHLPERDGLFIGLLVVEMMVRRGRKLSDLVQALFDRFGPHAYYRDDLHTTAAKKDRALERLSKEGGLAEIAGYPVERVETLDGFKHVTNDGWLLVRPSGTEPVLRVYAEAPTEARARAFVEDAVAQLGLGA